MTIEYEDSRSITRDDFLHIYEQCKRHIDKYIDDGDLLIVCDRGVNRSVSIAIAYGISRGMQYGELIDYINREKMQKTVN